MRLGRRAELVYYAVAGAALGDAIWIAAERGLSIIELVIPVSLAISAISSTYHDLEESISFLFSFLIPFLAVQVLLSFWYLSGIASLREFNYLSGYLLTTSVLSSVIFAVSFLLFSFTFRFIIEIMR